jgi:hypothetical protein
LVHEEGDSFGPRKAIVEDGGSTFRLPGTKLSEYLKLRPETVQTGWKPLQESIQEALGPHQLSRGKLWFGKTFYDAEGLSGAGGFGYFDPATRRYRIFSPPEIRRWSVSAILVEPENVWLGLMHRGEYGDTSGGVLHWDRVGAKARSFKIEAITTGLARYNGRLYLATTEGAAILTGARIRRFFVDYRVLGERTVSEANVLAGIITPPSTR